MLSLLQINLHKSKAASATLLLQLAEEEVDIVLIQEPYLINNVVSRLKNKDYNVIYPKNCGKVRSCIIIKNKLHSFLIQQYSDKDTTLISLELDDNKMYLAHDHETLPTGNLGSLVAKAEKDKVGIILAMLMHIIQSGEVLI